MSNGHGDTLTSISPNSPSSYRTLKVYALPKPRGSQTKTSKSREIQVYLDVQLWPIKICAHFLVNGELGLTLKFD
jgi:hypothetical protein